jgi:hypothetical protein
LKERLHADPHIRCPGLRHDCVGCHGAGFAKRCQWRRRRCHEFVSKGQDLAFYILEDDGKSPTPTKGFTGRAVIQDAGKTFAVNLSPAEPNAFVAQLPTPLGAKARVVFSAKVEGHNLQARFTTN